MLVRYAGNGGSLLGEGVARRACGPFMTFTPLPPHLDLISPRY